MARRRPRRTLTMGKRRYRRVFIIAAEGAKTEPAYFRAFAQNESIHVTMVPHSGHSAPPQVLKRMRQHLESYSRRSGDEAWIVIDKDRWTDAQLAEVHSWQREQPWHGLAVSNPMFELWLLLHFEDGHGVASAAECTRRLKIHLPNYRKNELDHGAFAGLLGDAVERGRRRDDPPCEDWPRGIGTTVYRLVEKLLASD